MGNQSADFLQDGNLYLLSCLHLVQRYHLVVDGRFPQLVQVADAQSCKAGNYEEVSYLAFLCRLNLGLPNPFYFLLLQVNLLGDGAMSMRMYLIII